MNRKIEIYQNPRASVLEAHRTQIAEMALLNWPLTEIRKVLEKDHQVKVAYSRLWTFCKTRNIVKGRGELPALGGDRIVEQTNSEPATAARPTTVPVAEKFPDSDDDISSLLNAKEEKSPFTIFTPNRKKL